MFCDATDHEQAECEHIEQEEERELSVCSCCGEYIEDDDLYGDEYTIVCRRCYDRYYSYCDQCDRLVHYDRLYTHPTGSYCQSCYEEITEESDSIHDYGYKPAPIFYGEGCRFFGVELEIDEGGKDYGNAEHILSTGNCEKEHIYIKSDGSLNDGMEIVTHPMTFEYHLENLPWRDILQKCIDMGYYSHNTDTCGLHVHINRSSLGDTPEEQENAIGRILYFFEKFWDQMLIFSRRTEEQLERWAARYGCKGDPKAVLDQAKKDCPGRYTCVNLLNRSTIEFRIFRGTLKYDTIAATLQLVDEICNVAVSLSDEEIMNMSWNDFAGRAAVLAHCELYEYLKKRSLISAQEQLEEVC